MSGRKLGRGLDVLIKKKPIPKGADVADSPPPVEPTVPAPVDDGVEALLTVIDVDPKSVEANPEQPRKDFSTHELEMLKASISQEGLLQPVLVRRVGEQLQLIVGERRLRAACELGLRRIPAIVTELEDDRLLEVALIENIQREDLNPVEIGRAYQQLMRVKGWTQETLARNLGISRSGVANSLRLLDLPEGMRSALVRQHITTGHAKVLLSVEDTGEQQQLFERIAEERLSVRELETAKEAISETASDAVAPPAPARTPTPKRSDRIVNLEEELSRAIGTRVNIAEATGGGKKGNKGKINIEFYSADDFERIRALLLAK